jgi:hypothetical protein
MLNSNLSSEVHSNAVQAPKIASKPQFYENSHDDTCMVITFHPNGLCNPFNNHSLALGMNNYAYKYQINPAGIGKDVMSIRYIRFLLQLLHDIFKFISP